MRGYSFISYAAFIPNHTKSRMIDSHEVVVPINAVVPSRENNDLVLSSPTQGPYDLLKPDLAIVSKSSIVSPREPLRFEFQGYSVWLELEQIDSDLDHALEAAALDHGLVPIPSPHVTVHYGISHLSETEARRRFREQLDISSWPPLKPKGVLSDISFDGVDGEEMDMAWLEVTLKTTQQHESLLQKVRNVFFAKDDELKPPSGPWLPHLSLAYDNPKDSPLSLPAAMGLAARFPTLLTERRVVGIALWSNYGKIQEWKCLDRIDL